MFIHICRGLWYFLYEYIMLYTYHRVPVYRCTTSRRETGDVWTKTQQDLYTQPATSRQPQEDYMVVELTSQWEDPLATLTWSRCPICRICCWLEGMALGRPRVLTLETRDNTTFRWCTPLHTLVKIYISSSSSNCGVTDGIVSIKLDDKLHFRRRWAEGETRICENCQFRAIED